MAQTAAAVDIFAPNNGTLMDAFQFGTAGDTSWSLAGQSFIMEVKASRDDPTGLATFTSAGGSIVVDDVVQRVLHLNVPKSVILASLPVGLYVYDLIMFDASVPPIRVPLMQGKFTVTQGVTES